MPSVHGGIGGFDTEPGTLWPLGDTVGMAALGLLEVSLRDLGLRWRVLGVEKLEVLAGRGGGLGAGLGAGLDGGLGGGAIGGKPAPLRVDCGGLCRQMRGSASGDWPRLVEDFIRDLVNVGSSAGLPTGLGTSLGTGPGAGTGTGGAAGTGLGMALGTLGGMPDGAASGMAGGASSTAWSRVEGLLRSRIVPTAVLPGLLVPGQGPEAVVCEPVTEDLAEVVEVCSGDSLRLARAGELAQWAVGLPAVLRRARENVRAEGALSSRRFTEEGAPLIALSGTGSYVPTHLHWLRRYLADEPGWSEQYGALVALPHRRLLVAHVIESAAVEQAAGALARFAYRQFETCPGPVSDQLYWWCEDRLIRLPSDSVGETLQVFPTDAFAILLARLRGQA